MSTERLGTERLGTERLGARKADAVPGTTAVPVTDLGDTRATGTWVAVDPPTRPPDRRALLRTARTTLLLAAMLVAAMPAPRAVPSSHDISVTLLADDGLGDRQADGGLGAADVRARLRNNGTAPLGVGRVQVLGAGSRPLSDVTHSPSARLERGGDLTLSLRLLPDCRDLQDTGRLAVRLDARGVGGADALRLPVRSVGDPLGAVCPRPRAGMHVVATAHRRSPDAGAVDVRLLNDGTLWATVVAPAATAASFDIRPALPLRLGPGEAMVLRLRRLATGPGPCAAASPRLEARSRYGYEAVRDEGGALAGMTVAADPAC